MIITETAIAGVLVLEPRVFVDERGFFFESFNEDHFNSIGRVTGAGAYRFVQDNHSRSVKNTIRGLHYQIHQAQGKLARVVAGEVFDVVVDLRESSPTFGNWIAERLSADNKKMIWIPPGMAHGFMAMTEHADLLYKTTDFWAPAHERTIVWNDPDLAIDWPLDGLPVIAPKDLAGERLAAAEVYP
jgi:dTDP-4-dehydrorhamnose 3,5-epimerase